MLVKLEKTFAIDAPADAAWTLLQDMTAVAACMPGAQITQRIDATHYQGDVSVKLGPASATFRGTLEIKSIDAHDRQIQILGKGSDASGASAASMDLTAQVRPISDRKCEVIGRSEVTVNGKLASFGSRLLTPVSDQLLSQFGANFAARALAMGQGAAAQAVLPKQLNALALLWQVVAGFFKSLFGGKKSGSAG